MRLVQRVVAVLIVVIVAWMGVNGAAALDAAPSSASIQDYTYDRHHHADQRTDQAYERAPPSAAYPDTVTPATDDPWSHGASARSPLAAILTDTTYDHAARSAQFDSEVFSPAAAVHGQDDERGGGDVSDPPRAQCDSPERFEGGLEQRVRSFGGGA